MILHDLKIYKNKREFVFTKQNLLPDGQVVATKPEFEKPA
jgi:hypothetical protein